MKLNKQITDLEHTDFVPVEETKEGHLRGGFGMVGGGDVSAEARWNIGCINECVENPCVNIICMNSGCGKTTTTTTTTTSTTELLQRISFSF